MIWRHRLFFELTKSCAVGNFEKDFEELYRNCTTLDDKISFLKAITFPPLSQYVKIRAYAHRLQLEKLHDLFMKSQPDFDDLCFLLVLLKHLSVLGSNSLVRREVIINSWKLYCYVVEHYKERCRDNNIENTFIPKLVFS